MVSPDRPADTGTKVTAAAVLGRRFAAARRNLGGCLADSVSAPPALRFPPRSALVSDDDAPHWRPPRLRPSLVLRVLTGRSVSAAASARGIEHPVYGLPRCGDWSPPSRGGFPKGSLSSRRRGETACRRVHLQVGELSSPARTPPSHFLCARQHSKVAGRGPVILRAPGPWQS